MLKTLLRFSVFLLSVFYSGYSLSEMIFYGGGDGFDYFDSYILSDDFDISLVSDESTDKAIYATAFCYIKSCPEISVNENLGKSKKYVEYALSREIFDIYFDLSYMYFNGVGFERDVDKAIYYLRKGAELGDVRSQVTLGDFYSRENQYFESVDYSQAFYWYNLAAKRGAELGMNKMYYYYKGKGVEKDYKEAFAWAKKIENVHPSDISSYSYKLSKCYEYGIGTQKNRMLAVKYYILLGSAGSDDVARLRAKMSEEEFREAVRLANEWQAEHHIRVPRYYQ